MLAQDASRQEQVREIQNQFAASPEWLLSLSAGAGGFAVEASEIEVLWQNGRLVLSCPTGRGWQNWTVLAWEKSGEKLIFQTARKLSGEAATLEFTPRVLIAALRADVKAARLMKAAELAETARKTFSKRAKIERVSLSPSNQPQRAGTIARILLAEPNGKSVAVCGFIVRQADPVNLLVNSLLWLNKLAERRRIAELWLVAEDDESGADLQKLRALLSSGCGEKIRIYKRAADENIRANSPGRGEEQILEPVKNLDFSELWTEKTKKLRHPKTSELSRTAQTILELAPEAIDVVFSKHKETLRFHGLPFVRIRKPSAEADAAAWFGIDARRKRILNENGLEEFSELLENLREHRRARAADKRNAFYKAAPEAWLESILRRDVSRLDPNLVLAPLYAQFRLSNKQGALDLLALRTDGRLVVIELKTRTDRQHVFQAVNYWRQIEQHRRQGNFKNSRLFGDLSILDAPPLVYLVAPLMSFHRDFEILANAITPEIEIWRFDLNEDWRGGIRVAQRTKIARRP